MEWMRPMSRPKIAAGLVGLLLVLASCGAGAGGSPGAAGIPGPVGESAASAAADEATGGEASGDGDPARAAQADRKIVKTGEISVQVESVESALGEIRLLALELDGYVGGSRAGTADDAATLTLRIPAARFDAAIERVHELGELVAEATREEDVTSSIVDLEARITNLEASEAQYRALLDRAETIEEILTVQSRLDGVRGEIEQHKAQLEQLSGQATLATLTVTLVPEPEDEQPVVDVAAGWDPGATVGDATATLLAIGQAVGTLAIWLGIVILPVALVTGLVAAVVMRSSAVRRRWLAGRPDEHGTSS